MTMPTREINFQSLIETFTVFLKLGLLSFGGPIAHLGYFRSEFVERRKWISERSYAELIALCQFLPGPASSQVGFALGLHRAGLPGACAAWLGFTMPSAIALVMFALGLRNYGQYLPAGFISGLKILAVAVVAQAVWTMGRQFCPDKPRLMITAMALILLTVFPHHLIQLGVIALAGVVGVVLFRRFENDSPHVLDWTDLSPRYKLLLPLFFLLLFALPFIAELAPSKWTAIGNIFYQAGALVFGGGHVVLPLLELKLVPPGWVSAEEFIAGYGAAQAVPGPLFTFAAYLGAVLGTGDDALMLALFALAMIFIPGFLLLLSVLPLWGHLRNKPWAQAALKGVNAAVVGLLLAALFDPLIKTSLHDALDIIIAIFTLTLLVRIKIPVLLALAVSVGLSCAKFLLLP